MRPTTLLFVRHGHVADNDHGRGARLTGWLDAPLSPLGRAQAERLGARLANGPRPDALYASPLRRARDTAEALATALGASPRLLGSLREIHCGRLDGLPLEQVQRRYPQLWRRNLAQESDAFRWPGGESYREFRARVLRAVRHIAQKHRGGRVVIVTHSGVITQVLGALHRVPAARWSTFVVSNASITEVRWDCGTGTLLRGDDRRHLERGSAVPDRVGAPDHPEVIARRPSRLGPGAGRGAAPAVRDREVIA